MHLRASLAALSILAVPTLLPAGAAFAADYYVAPLSTVQSCTTDGSQACPWVGLNAALYSKKLVGGDRLLLQDGDYGGMNLYMISFSGPIVIQSLNEKKAHFEYIVINEGTKGLTFKNLSVWPSNPDQKTSDLFVAYTSSSTIVVDGLDVRGGQDAANYMSWSQSEWLSRAASGINLRGPNSSIMNSRLVGVYMGAKIEGANSSMLNNYVEGFSGDSYEVLGDNSVVSGNVSKNCFQIDANHADALQSWADADGVINGLTIENNTFLEWASTSSNSLRCVQQGIGFFDGPYENVIIRNNVVSGSSYHGISVYGGRNVQILNNTVVSAKGLEGGIPYIGVFKQKNGSLPQNVLVANNLAMSFYVDSGIDSSNAAYVKYVNNSTLMGLGSLFQDISNFDYRPTSASGFIDTGSAADSPATDILGAARPYGAGPDRGAYEIGASSGTTSGTTTTGGTTTGGTDGTTTGGTTTGGTTTGGTTTGGTTGGTTTTPPPTWTPKFLKPPKKN